MENRSSNILANFVNANKTYLHHHLVNKFSLICFSRSQIRQIGRVVFRFNMVASCMQLLFFYNPPSLVYRLSFDTTGKGNLMVTAVTLRLSPIFCCRIVQYKVRLVTILLTTPRDHQIWSCAHINHSRKHHVTHTWQTRRN